MSLQDHVHLGLYSNWPTNHDQTLYHAAMPGYDDRPTVAVSATRSLTGKLLVYRSLGSGGEHS